MADELLKFDGGSLRELARDLRRAAEDFRRETDKTLAKVGLELVGAAKAIAGQHSKTVSGTIKMRAAPGMVVITVGNEDTPIAALWEMGNKGSHDTGKVQGVFFRHPVFGQDVWVDQRRFPMLRPAEQALRREIQAKMNSTFDRVLEPYRLRTEGV